MQYFPLFAVFIYSTKIYLQYKSPIFICSIVGFICSIILYLQDLFTVFICSTKIYLQYIYTANKLKKIFVKMKSNRHNIEIINKKE